MIVKRTHVGEPHRTTSGYITACGLKIENAAWSVVPNEFGMVLCNPTHLLIPHMITPNHTNYSYYEIPAWRPRHPGVVISQSWPGNGLVITLP